MKLKRQIDCSLSRSKLNACHILFKDFSSLIPHLTLAVLVFRIRYGNSFKPELFFTVELSVGDRLQRLLPLSSSLNFVSTFSNWMKFQLFHKTTLSNDYWTWHFYSKEGCHKYVYLVMIWQIVNNNIEQCLLVIQF